MPLIHHITNSLVSTENLCCDDLSLLLVIYFLTFSCNTEVTSSFTGGNINKPLIQACAVHLIDVILILLENAQGGCPDCLQFIWCVWIKEYTLLAASETSTAQNNFKCKYNLTMKIYLCAFTLFSEQTRAGSRSQVTDCTGSLSAASEICR